MANKKISDLTSYTPAVDTDVLPIVDTTTATTKKITWANIKATLKTYFDTLYPSGSGTSTGTNTGDNTVATALTGTPSITVATVTTTGNIELGNASDTTLSRSSAGVLAVEGAAVPTVSSTSTLTNKRITKRVVTTTDDASAAIDTDITDEYELSAMANATTFTVTGTPTDGQNLIIRLKDNGTARALTWTMSGGVIGVVLPTTTVISKWSVVGFKYFSSTTSWKCIAVGQEA